MKQLTKLLSIMLVLTLSHTAFATNNKCQDIDKKLTHHFDTIVKNSHYYDNDDIDTLEKHNLIVRSLLTEFAKDKASLSCNLPLATKKWLNFRKSADNKLRIYSWDTAQGGTMRDYDTVIQYVDKHNKVHVLNADNSKKHFISSPTHLITTRLGNKGNNNKATYILVDRFPFSISGRYQKMKLYQIQGNKLISPKLIKTRSGKTSEIGFSFHQFSVPATINDEYIDLFKFDEKKKAFSFPVVLESKKYAYGDVQNRYITYQFDGKYFRRVRTK